MNPKYAPLEQENIDWYDCCSRRCLTVPACYDPKWTNDLDNMSARYRMKAYNLWFCILHLINFVVLLTIGLNYNLLSEKQTLVDTSLIPIGTVQVGVFVLVSVAITVLYHFSYEVLYYMQPSERWGSKITIFQDMVYQRNPYKWLFEYAVNYSLMVFSICVVCGTTDINFLIIFCLLNVFTNVFFNMWQKHDGFESYIMGVFVSIVLWIFVIRQAVLTNINSYSAGALAFGVINQLGLDILAYNPFVWKSYNYDLAFLVWSFVMKTIISWLIFGYLLN